MNAKSLAGIATAILTAAGSIAAAAPALAADFGTGTRIETGPETPLSNDKLPLVTTTRTGALKPNILNPRPVCNAWGEHRTVIYEVTPHYKPVGTLTFTNNNDEEATISQSISRSKSLTLSVSGDVGGSFKGATATVHLGVSHTETWNQGQTLNQTVKAHHTNYVSYGFNTISFKGTQQYCKADGTWSDPWPLFGSAPTALAVRTVQTTDAGSAVPTITPDTGSNMGQPISVPEPPKVTATSPDPDKHISIGYQVSPMKAKGFTGLVDIKATNKTANRYYNFNQPAMFLVQVKTAEGPKGVDRLMNLRPHSGATVIDYGFNEKTSTRSFLVSLSNPVYAHQTLSIGTLWFGDGLTSEGRLVNSIQTTLLNPLGNVSSDDTTVAPDWTADNTRVDSSKGATKDDFGRPHGGLF